MNRRAFLGSLSASIALPLIAHAQQGQEQGQQPVSGATNAPMDESRYIPVRLPARGPAVLSNLERDALEHRIHCQCGCELDVYTCRTTDFACPVSPLMHADVMGLVSGGYVAAEILSAFTKAYGPRAMMSPPKSGFNLAGWVVPFLALGTGAVIVSEIIRRWSHDDSRPVTRPAAHVDATPDELKRLDEALRRDE
jgi:cytochrome c-type biogenesis protein CcmH